LNNRNMYHLPHGVQVPPVQRLRDHAVVVPGVVQVVINMTLDLVVVAFSPTALADHVFPTWCPLFSNGT
jgi:hypothetical protein